MLAIGVTLPTTIFMWSSTGIGITVRDYFGNNVYQMRVGHVFVPQLLDDPGELSFLNGYRDDQEQVLESALEYPFIERTDYVPSTLGIITGFSGAPFIPGVGFYTMWSTNYLTGIKDCRVIPVTNDLLSLWSAEFNFEGNLSLDVNQVLVSQGFVDYTEEVYGVVLEVGDLLSLDVFRHPDWRHIGSGFPSGWSQQSENDLLIAGIYDIKSLTSIISESFPSLTRKNWDPNGLAYPVLGIDDSIMLLEDQFTDDGLLEMKRYGLFYPAAFVRASYQALLEYGEGNIKTTMLGMKEQLEQIFPEIPMDGVQRLDALQIHIDGYLQSLSLTVLAFPTLTMSVLLTIFIAELSIERRKGEVSAVRAKGASYNQVFSSLMWESLILTLVGYCLGLGMSIFLSPLMGASVGLFEFDPNQYADFLANTRVSTFGLVIGAVIAAYLPGAYLFQIARRIDIKEIGQSHREIPSATLRNMDLRRFFGALIGVVLVLLLMPIIIAPYGIAAYAEVLITTVLLFVAATLGSRLMRLATARFSSFSYLVLGERHIYITQSFRRRKGQFVPLFLVLTLTMTVTTMILIQSSSFNATLDNELSFSIGADMRIERQSTPLDFNTTLVSYPGVHKVTQVVETVAQTGSHTIMLQGLNALEYLEIGKFAQDGFVNGTPSILLNSLAATSNGIIISEYHANLWNISVGDNTQLHVALTNGSKLISFQIVGLARNAPGFGAASTATLHPNSFASQFGFQVSQGGFALVNLDFLTEETKIKTADLFLVDTISWNSLESVIEELEQDSDITIYTVESFNFAEESRSINLFLIAFEGSRNVTLLMCIVMGLTAIAFFLGSAVIERQSEYAIFRAVGATKKQLVTMVFGEFAAIVFAAAAISFLLGTVFGYSMGILTIGVSPFSNVLPVILSFPVYVILGILGSESLVMAISCYIPARKAGAINPAQVLRNL